MQNKLFNVWPLNQANTKLENEKFEWPQKLRTIN